MSLSHTPALVARLDIEADFGERYLRVTPTGRSAWVGRPEAATAFGSMRDAAFIARRLAPRVQAFCLPREPELAPAHAV